MSPSTRIVIGVDERGRPKAEWRPTPGSSPEPAYGFMEPAHTSTIERRKATPQELEAARAREGEPSHLVDVSSSRPLIVRRDTSTVTEAAEPAPAVAPAPPPEEDPAVAITQLEKPSIDLTPLDKLALAAAEASRLHAEKEAADAAWDIARGDLERAVALCRDFVGFEGVVVIQPTAPASQDVAGPTAKRRNAREPRVAGLSPRQAEAIALMSEGHNRAEVARQMATTYQTVDGLLEAAAKKGLLPAELVPLLPARFAKYSSLPA